MRTTPLILASLVFTLLAACTSNNQAKDDQLTLIGWVLEEAGTNDEGQALTRISVYADTINARHEAAITKIFEVETLPGCTETSNAEVRCAQADHTDEFQLHQETAGGTITFDHRNIAAGTDDPALAFKTFYTFEEEDFGTPLDVGYSRTTPAVPK